MKKAEEKSKIKASAVTKFNPFLGQKRARVLFEQYVEAAMEGNIEAAKIVFPYVFPKPKSRLMHEIKVTKKTLKTQAQSILDFIYAGELDSETGEKILSCISKVVDLNDRHELEERIQNLEEHLSNANNRPARKAN